MPRLHLGGTDGHLCKPHGVDAHGLHYLVSRIGQTQGSQDRTDASLVISQLLFDFYSTEHEIKIQENTEFAERLAREQAAAKLALKMLTNTGLSTRM